MLENRCFGIREIVEALNISYGSTQHILVDVLGMKRVATRLVPRDLNFLQKERRVKVAKEMLANVSDDHIFITRMITGDETWVYEYDIETAQESSEWRAKNEPKPKNHKSKSVENQEGQTVIIHPQDLKHFYNILYNNFIKEIP
ncbi:hypothetical protein NQ318_020806 [Aromia moschata]|uniref:Transposase n=1 Tax=Aromia moschata TaxID=1265417 RepID=A0AAV8XIN4_9CUCU|nr:hypothetical protein NQ318_020806 [Aromia moschata]